MFDTLSEKFANAFKHLAGERELKESHIESVIGEVRTALLEADVNFKVVKKFIAQVKERAIGEKRIGKVSPQDQFIKIVQDELAQVMGGSVREIDFKRNDPIPLVIVGLNGQGKTSFCAKLAYHLVKKQHKKCVVVPADTFRPAAKKQLETLSKQAGVECFDSDLSLSPAEIALAAMEEAKRQRQDVVIIDTAGRLHIDDQLMTELAVVRSSLSPFNPEVLMVADCLTGQEAVNVARSFQEKIQLTGVVLSKVDSDARGGAALSISHITNLPIFYMSTGEKVGDLEPFHPDRLASRILDKGDVVSLVEKAEEAIDQEDAEQMMKKMEKGRFSIEDFLKQVEMIKKLGSLTGLLKMLPGMGGMLRKLGDLNPAESEIAKMKVIASSMTRKERSNYKIIKESRIERIAKGSGHTTSTVRSFLARFAQMEQMMGTLGPLLKGGGQLPSMAALAQQKKKRKGKKRGPWGKHHFS